MIAVLILLVAMVVILCCCAMRQRMSRARQAMAPTWILPSYGSMQGYVDLKLGVQSDALKIDSLHPVQCESKVPLLDVAAVPLQETPVVRWQAVARGFLARIRLGAPPHAGLLPIFWRYWAFLLGALGFPSLSSNGSYASRH